MANSSDIYKPAETEEDLPPVVVNTASSSGAPVSNVSSKKISASERKWLEESKTNQFNRLMRILLTKYGIIILIAALIALILLYIIDTILINNNCKSSSLLNPLFELFKFITSSLLGYIFANNLSKNIGNSK